MKYPHPLTQGRLVKRYKRFLADVILPATSSPKGEEQLVTAHCGNPGSMMGLAEEGSMVWLSPNTNPKAKLDWRWEIASQHIAGTPVPVGINTNLANHIVEEALIDKRIPALSDYSSLRREVKYGTASRIDFLLEEAGLPACYVEVKSVTLRRPDGPAPKAAEFPDAVTSRGTKHLHELTTMCKQGARAAMLYLVQRADCDHLSLARDIDPTYAQALTMAMAEGVDVICYDCHITPEGININKSLNFVPHG